MTTSIENIHVEEKNVPTVHKKLSDSERLSIIDPSERILLLSHCLRNSTGCQATSDNEEGLVCRQCDPECQINRMRNLALDLGYGGVCVAPGGSLAVKYVKNKRPAGIVAVACRKELKEGVETLMELAEESKSLPPPVVIVPLTKDGCIDTEVNLSLAFKRISLGC